MGKAPVCALVVRSGRLWSMTPGQKGGFRLPATELGKEKAFWDMGLSAMVLKPTFTSRGFLVHEACQRELMGQGNVPVGRAQAGGRTPELGQAIGEAMEQPPWEVTGQPPGEGMVIPEG